MIKTEQELKDALEDIFFDALTDTSNPPYYTDKVDPENDGYWQCKVYELCADELIKRGYGDISEYKAEIERLNSHNGFLQSVISHSKDMLDEAVKQAQIDTINTIVKYCENPNHWRELKDCKLFGGKSDDLRNFLNGIFKEIEND